MKFRAPDLVRIVARVIALGVKAVVRPYLYVRNFCLDAFDNPVSRIDLCLGQLSIFHVIQGKAHLQAFGIGYPITRTPDIIFDVPNHILQDQGRFGADSHRAIRIDQPMQGNKTFFPVCHKMPGMWV